MNTIFTESKGPFSLYVAIWKIVWSVIVIKMVGTYSESISDHINKYTISPT